MELISITQARVVALIQVQQWDPLGKALTLEALAKLGNRYIFTKTPTRLEEIDFQKGLELQEGRLGEIRIDRIIIYMNGIVIDTRSSTDDSEKVLEDIIALAHEAFGAVIRPARQTFASQLMFRSDMHLAALNPVLPKIANLLTQRTSADMKHPFTFEPTAVLFNVDTAQAKTPPPMLSIERRVDVPFDENTYFSQAPLPTAEHIEILKAFEAALR
jgi:hypothetical protein